MQNVSGTYERLAKSANKDYETKLVIDGVGEFYEEDSLKSLSTNIALFSGAPEVGKAVSQEISATMLMPSATIPRMACLRPYIRAKGTAAKSSDATVTGETISSPWWIYSSGRIAVIPQAPITITGETLSFPVDSTEQLTSEWIPQGVFFVDTREVTANENGVPVLSLHGYDAMMKTEQDYASNFVVGDAPDTSYVSAIANAIGVEVDSRTWDIMKGYMMPFPLGYTMREILGYIAASYIGCFIMTDEGKLRLVSLLGLPERVLESVLGDEYGDAILFGGVGILV